MSKKKNFEYDENWEAIDLWNAPIDIIVRWSGKLKWRKKCKNRNFRKKGLKSVLKNFQLLFHSNTISWRKIMGFQKNYLVKIVSIKIEYLGGLHKIIQNSFWKFKFFLGIHPNFEANSFRQISRVLYKATFRDQRQVLVHGLLMYFWPNFKTRFYLWNHPNTSILNMHLIGYKL